MEIKITYPPRRRAHRFWRVCCKIYNILFVIALFACPLVNIWLGGKLWCIVAIYGAYLIWSSFISPSLYELNRTYQSIKLFLQVLILLIGIDLLLCDGAWGLTVIPIVSFGGLIVCTALFFSDFQRQKHNAVPFVLITILSLAAGLFGMFSDLIETKWTFLVLTFLSLTVLIVSLIFLRKTILYDLKKQLNTK